MRPKAGLGFLPFCAQEGTRGRLGGSAKSRLSRGKASVASLPPLPGQPAGGPHKNPEALASRPHGRISSRPAHPPARPDDRCPAAPAQGPREFPPSPAQVGRWLSKLGGGVDQWEAEWSGSEAAASGQSPFGRGMGCHSQDLGGGGGARPREKRARHPRPPSLARGACEALRSRRGKTSGSGLAAG